MTLSENQWYNQDTTSTLNVSDLTMHCTWYKQVYIAHLSSTQGSFKNKAVHSQNYNGLSNWKGSYQEEEASETLRHIEETTRINEADLTLTLIYIWELVKGNIQ